MPKQVIKTLCTEKGALTYVLQRKRMKTIRVKVEGDSVVVSCGAAVPLRTVEEFLLRQLGWIEDAKRRQGMKRNGVVPELLENGETFHFLGLPRAVRGVPAGREGAALKGGTLLLYVKNDDTASRRRVFLKWLAQSAREVFQERLEAIYPHFAREIGRMPVIALRSMKSRWGSAHVRKYAITLNTALVLAPLPLIDYVIAHELAHFVHANHSKEYYGVLSAHMPDWKQRKNLLNRTYTAGL